MKLTKKDKLTIFVALIPIMWSCFQMFVLVPMQDKIKEQKHKKERDKWVKRYDSIKERRQLDSIDWNRIIINKFKKKKR